MTSDSDIDPATRQLLDKLLRETKYPARGKGSLEDIREHTHSIDKSSNYFLLGWVVVQPIIGLAVWYFVTRPSIDMLLIISATGAIVVMVPIIACMTFASHWFVEATKGLSRLDRDREMFEAGAEALAREISSRHK